jgi:hypothetical protein
LVVQLMGNSAAERVVAVFVSASDADARIE